MTRRLAMLVAVVSLAAAAPAAAEPLRLRGDALASTRAPTGLLVLQADDRSRPWISAEALVWVGAGDEADADALAVSVWLKDPRGRATLRLGRQVFATGALRPVHADGAAGLVRLPWRTTIEAFGGVPVIPGLGPRGWDWVVGARVAQPLGPARIGVAWLRRLDGGSLDTHELGLDAAVAPDAPWDLAAGAAYDLVYPGLAELRLSAAGRMRGYRLELYGVHRSASHLLPATSLFSVLGDAPSERAGLQLRWRAAPRLDVWAAGGVRRLDRDVGADASLRALLRLDDAGDGAIGVELRRDGGPDGAWTGARLTFRQAIGPSWGVASELELVVSDSREQAWPWGLVALTWLPARGWEVAGAAEASASPTDVYRIDVIARVSRAWELP